MEKQENPYASPRQLANARVLSRDTSRIRDILLGGLIGLVMGAVWTAVFDQLTDGPPSIFLSFQIYEIGFTVTGVIVGLVRRLPVLIGAAVGVTTLCFLAAQVAPTDGWFVLWLIVFGGSGLIWGAIIGGAFYYFRSRRIASSRGTDSNSE